MGTLAEVQMQSAFLAFVFFPFVINTYFSFTFCRHSEGLLDLGEVENQGQLVYLTAVG